MATKAELETENETLRSEAARVAALVSDRDAVIATLEARIASLEAGGRADTPRPSTAPQATGNGYQVTNPRPTVFGVSIPDGDDDRLALSFPPGASRLSESRYRELADHPNEGVRVAFSELFAPRGPLQITAVL